MNKITQEFIKVKQNVIKNIILVLLFFSTIYVTFSDMASAQTFSANQIQLHFGSGYHFGGNGMDDTTRTMVELQHFSAYDYGDLFYFVDIYGDHKWDGASSRVGFYGELYGHMGLKSLGVPIDDGSFLADIGPGVGINAGADFLVSLYGVRASFKVPGFSLLTFGVYAYDNQIDPYGRALDTTYQATLIWDIPFKVGAQKFSTGGVIDWIGPQGAGVERQIYFQPEVRWDIGSALGGKENSLEAGLRYVHFNNKYGVKDVDDNAFSVFVTKKF
ncbi:hypothetical protein PV773_01020 [Mesorhizobium sp. CC13]|uniref:hypothetical protein n=1 Tax=Mesorhizobium sp. CC13 TaxID=3029194 RepID=UPI0032634535